MSLTMREKASSVRKKIDNAGSPGKAVRTAIKHDNLIARVHSSTERIRRRDLDDWIAGLSERPR